MWIQQIYKGSFQKCCHTQIMDVQIRKLLDLILALAWPCRNWAKWHCSLAKSCRKRKIEEKLRHGHLHSWIIYRPNLKMRIKKTKAKILANPNDVTTTKRFKQSHGTHLEFHCICTQRARSSQQRPRFVTSRHPAPATFFFGVVDIW